MKNLFLGVSGLAMMASVATAGGLDRSGQSVSAIFADDNTASLSFGYVAPSITGTDSQGASYDVGNNYSQIGLSYTNSINDKVNYTVIFDQPYGADVSYNVNPFISNLGGTSADLNSQAVSFVARFKLNDRISIFGGIKGESVDAEVSLNGTSYASAIAVSAVAGATPGVEAETLGAALQGDMDAQLALGPLLPALAGAVSTQATNFLLAGGYSFDMEKDTKMGYVLGAAYEIPEIALRFALTYSPEIQHKAKTTENIFGTVVSGDVEYVTPQSVNLEFQTGIAANTLLTAGYRWTEFSAVDVIPDALGTDLVNLDDSHRYSIGMARRYSDALASSITLTYEPEGEDNLVSPLGPTNGMVGVTIGARYTEGPLNISGGVNYTKVGDALAEVGGSEAASFEDNHVWGVGFKAEMSF